MIIKKRGFMFVVLVLFFLSINITLAEWKQPQQDIWKWGEDVENDQPHVYKYAYMKTSRDDGKVGVGHSRVQDNFCEAQSQSDEDWGHPNYNDCGYENCCAIQLVNYVHYHHDDCSGSYVKGGTIISPLFDTHLNYVGGDWESYESGYHPSSVRGASGNSFICDNHAWKECSAETVGSFLDVAVYDSEDKVKGEDYLHDPYFCVAKSANNQISYQWVKFDDPAADKDGDKVPVVFDCDDNDPSVFGNFTQYDPAAPVPTPICGDGKSNTCGAVKDENDNCNQDKVACQSNCLVKGGLCSWIDTVDANACCGDTANDFGIITDSSKKEGNYVCLNKNLVGYNGKDLTKESYWGVKISDSEKTCQGDWCWVNAISDASFHILTIKKAGESAYDLVSNSDKWMECKDSNSIKDISSNILGDKTRNANRFTCYQEGNHFSWADCRAKEADEQIQPHFNGIKERGQGDGTFALPIDSAKSKGSKVTVDTSKLYESYYGEIPTDFIPPDGATQYLEFYVRFTKDPVTLPANVYLGIYGPKQQNDQGQDKNILYFDQDVLGYATNNPTLSLNRWMHVKIPVPALRNVKYLEFRSAPEENEIEVRNVYLTYSDNPQICSGEYSDFPGKSAWLNNMDYWVEGEKIKADKLCNVLYDPQSDATGDNGAAWLGGQEVSSDSKRCCGNNEHEYYAGVSKNGYGCWNSQPIKGNQTVMDVAFSVGYNENMISVNYPEVQFDAGYVKKGLNYDLTSLGVNLCPTISSCDDVDNQLKKLNNYFVTLKICHSLTKQDCTGVKKDKSGEKCQVSYINLLGVDSVSNFNCDYIQTEPQVDAPYDSVSSIPIEFDKLFKVGTSYYTIQEKNDEQKFTNKKITLPTSPLKIDTLNLEKKDFATPFSEPYYGEITITNSNPNQVYVYLVDPLLPNDKLDKINAASMPAKATYYLTAEVTEAYPIEVKSNVQQMSNTFTYSCMQSECLYPLPGLPPYTITNPHPDLYELYFVKDSKKEHDVLVSTSNNVFNEKGNLRVRKVAQQVVYSYSDEKQDFYGCQAAGYLEGNDKVKPENNLGYCTVAGGKFCSHSVSVVEVKDKYTTINSWSDEKISKVGYLELKDVNTVADLPLQLKDADPVFGADKRNYTAVILPARNFLSNAEFKTNGLELPHWQILVSSGSGTKEGKQTKDGVVVLENGEKLRSEKIAVAENVNLYFTQNLTCDTKISLVDKNGISTEAGLPQFNTGVSSYAVVEFTGPCQVKQPMLQRVDELGMSSYYTTQTGLDDDARSGVTCCPQDYCWNGYACVEPMSSLTYLAEHISQGRDYRCIGGNWEYLPVKNDWNNDPIHWGFCAAKEDCLVLGSNFGGDEKNIPKDFYDGKYPTCVKNGEFIFDHYCDNGNWTSRTKFVASKLLEAAATNDYVLYCSNYEDTLVSTSDNELSHIAGIQAGAKPTGSLDTLGNVPEQAKICFKSVLGEGKRLVPDKENTCVNNFCVLKLKDGDSFKVAFATTLNKNITDKDSFLFALNVPQDRLNTLCVSKEQGKFVTCDLKDLELKGDLWYNADINGLIYGKDGIGITKGPFKKILDWFKGLFGQKKSELSDESLFVTKAVNFKDLYLLKDQEKKIRAVREVLPEKQTLIAEYENFNTSVCDYLNNLELPPDAKAELLEKVTSKEKVSCTIKGNKQRVEAVAGLDFFWRQMTGKMRVEEK